MKTRFLPIFLVPLGLCALCVGGVMLWLEVTGPSSIAVQPLSREFSARWGAVIDANSVARIEELVCLESREAGPVAALTFTPDATEILVIHGETGILRRWRIDDSILLSEFSVDPVGMAAVSFDGTAGKLAGGARVTPLTEGTPYATDLEGIRLWDTHSGKQLYELGKYDMVADLALSSDGERLVSVEPGGLDQWNAKTGKSVLSGIIAGEVGGRRGGLPIYEVSIGPLGELILYASAQGEITLISWDREKEGYIPVRLAGNSSAVPLASTIDPSRRWVALLRENSLEVWRLRAWRIKPRLKVNLADTPLGDLAFSPDGSLLAVSTAKGWQIWSMSRKRLEAKVTGQSVYAVAFSPDGRLFAFGDTDGSVYLWGVPTE